MSNPDDPINAVEALATQHKANEQSLRAALESLGDRLSKVCRDCSITYGGENIELQWCSPDEVIWGHFWCTGDGLRIAFHSMPYEEEDDGFALKTIGDSPLQWIRELGDQKRIERFVRGFHEHVERIAADIHAKAGFADRLANSPTFAVVEEFERVAQAVGFPRAVADWREAQAALLSSPERAISLSCSLFETVCKHLLNALGVGLPADQSVAPLFKATAKALGLDPTQQAEAELRGFCGGLATVVQQLGLLRTRFGEAHGKGAEQKPLSRTHARLVVNAAGATATFMMELWAAKNKVDSTKV